MTALAQPTRPARALRMVAIVLVFVLIGPPVGAIVFLTSTALIGFAEGVDLAGLTWVALFALIYAAPLSYLIGALPAAAAGVIVGTRQAWLGPATLLDAVAVGLAVGLGTLVLSGQRLTVNGGASVPVILLTCLVPTLVCWLTVRGWVFEPHTGPVRDAPP